MKVILVIIMSVDGKTTKNNNANTSHWNSKEDQKYFFSLIEKHNLHIMGRYTYEHAKHLMQHKNGRMRIVLTRTPEKFAHETLPNTLEFAKTKPKLLLGQLAKQGYKQTLLLGGARTSTEFAKEKLIDEVWLTIEPYLFGKGKSLFCEELVDFSLSLQSIKKLNTNGTLLLKYKVLR